MPITLHDTIYYRTAEALKRAGISRATFYRWLASGRIADSGQRDRNGHRIFTQQEIEALAEYAGRVETTVSRPAPPAATSQLGEREGRG
jgi:hypothetical protein